MAKQQKMAVILTATGVRCDWCHYPHSKGCIYRYPMRRERDIRREEAQAKEQEQA